MKFETSPVKEIWNFSAHCEREENQIRRRSEIDEPESTCHAVRDPDTKRFVCYLCAKSFLYKQGLQKHHNKEHNPNVTNRVKYQRQADDPDLLKVKCGDCPKVFKYKQGNSNLLF